jgi:hypothetical protein
VLGVESAWRAIANRPGAALSQRLETILLILLVITSAGGVGLVVGGSGPHEPLHYLYAALALAGLPIANSLSRNAGPRRQAIVTFVAALIVVVVILRLFQTG